MGKTRQQIKNFILKTLLPYKKDKTTCAIKNDECRYLINGKKCAVGQWLKKGKWQKSKQFASVMFETYGFDILFKRAKDMEFTINEWNFIQTYHDDIAFNRCAYEVNGTVRILEREFNVELPELKFVE